MRLHTKVTISVDACEPDELPAIADEHSIDITITNPHGPSGHAVAKLTGPFTNVLAALLDSWDDGGGSETVTGWIDAMRVIPVGDTRNT